MLDESEADVKGLAVLHLCSFVCQSITDWLTDSLTHSPACCVWVLV
jgi:hypothetical protein